MKHLATRFLETPFFNHKPEVKRLFAYLIFVEEELEFSEETCRIDFNDIGLPITCDVQFNMKYVPIGDIERQTGICDVSSITNENLHYSITGESERGVMTSFFNAATVSDTEFGFDLAMDRILEAVKDYEFYGHRDRMRM